jgi:MoaA/NifB/PqqE/SkfB family radical SAM enzyme
MEKPSNIPICFAPWISLNFDRFGNVTPCCYNRTVKYGNVNEKSLLEIFKSKRSSELKKKILNSDFSMGCQLCGKCVDEGHPERALFNNFNNISDIYNNGMPSIFEFEMHNACNLQCVMCSGEYSSLIRKNIEKKEPLPFVYTDKFLDDLRYFIPHLKMCRFLGGEPFVIPFYFKILSLIEEFNKDCKVFFTSNINYIPEKGWYYLSKLKNFNVIGSIDSLTKENYEKIRIGGSFELMKHNLKKLLKLKKLKVMTINPLVYNFNELPAMLKFAEHNNIDLYFNFTVDFLSGKKEGIHIKDGATLYSKLFLHELSNEEFLKGMKTLKKLSLTNKYNDIREKLLIHLQKIYEFKNTPTIG